MTRLFFIVILLLSPSFYCLSQAELGIEKVLDSLETPKVLLYIDGDFAYLAIKENEKWTSLELFDERIGHFEANLKVQDINGKGEKEIIINWTNGVYGSGSQTTNKGVQIWDIDSKTCYLNVIYDCEIYTSGKYDNSKPIIENCTREVNIRDRKIEFKEITCDTNSNLESFNITKIPNGVYVLENGKLIKK